MTSAFMQTHPGEVTVHPPQQFYAGDDWAIIATCTDRNGNPINLVGAELVWRFNDADGNVKELTNAQGGGITLAENASGDLIDGTALITVAKNVTITFPIDNYTDELTVTAAGHTGTQWRGRIDVLAKLPGPVSGD